MHEKQNNNWQRLEQVIRWANMTTNYFARHIGLARGENLYQIKRGFNGISLDLARRVVEHFPEIDMLWLLTGQGQMFSVARRDGVRIPYYKRDAEREIARVESLQPDDYFELPPLQNCDLAMRYEGRAMEGAIAPGAVLFLRRVACEEVIPGDDYLVVTPRLAALRTVRAAQDAGLLRLVAASAAYDDLFVAGEELQRIYHVQGVLTLR